MHTPGYSMPDGTVINPGTLNHWLRVNGYYLNEGESEHLPWIPVARRLPYYGVQALNPQPYCYSFTVIFRSTAFQLIRISHWNTGGDPNNLNLTAPNLIDPGFIHFISEKEKPSEDVMRKWVDHTNPVMIAHVSVLFTGQWLSLIPT